MCGEFCAMKRVKNTSKADGDADFRKLGSGSPFCAPDPAPSGCLHLKRCPSVCLYPIIPQLSQKFVPPPRWGRRGSKTSTPILTFPPHKDEGDEIRKSRYNATKTVIGQHYCNKRCFFCSIRVISSFSVGELCHFSVVDLKELG